MTFIGNQPIIKILKLVDTTGIPPIAVLCKDAHIKEANDFNLSHKNVYRYEVLGGLHSVTARQELLQQHPGDTMYTAKI